VNPAELRLRISLLFILTPLFCPTTAFNTVVRGFARAVPPIDPVPYKGDWARPTEGPICGVRRAFERGLLCLGCVAMRWTGMNDMNERGVDETGMSQQP
jgi:hypothetical protein